MSKQILVNASSYETRVAILQDGEIKALHIEREEDKNVVGNVYKGIVKRVLPGMQAAFLELGLERTAFLYVDDIIDEPFGRDIELLDDDEEGDSEGASDYTEEEEKDERDDNERQREAERNSERFSRRPRSGRTEQRNQRNAQAAEESAVAKKAEPVKEGEKLVGEAVEGEEQEVWTELEASYERDELEEDDWDGEEGEDDEEDLEEEGDFDDGDESEEPAEEVKAKTVVTEGREVPRAPETARKEQTTPAPRSAEPVKAPEAKAKPESDPAHEDDGRAARQALREGRAPGEKPEPEPPRTGGDRGRGRGGRGRNQSIRAPRSGGGGGDRGKDDAPPARETRGRSEEAPREDRDRNRGRDEDRDRDRPERGERAERNDRPERDRGERDRDETSSADRPREDRGRDDRGPRDERPRAEQDDRPRGEDRPRNDDRPRGEERSARSAGNASGSRGRERSRGGRDRNRARRGGAPGAAAGGRRPPRRNFRNRRPRGSANIQDLLKEGQEILVQVAKAPIGTKGARLTTHISLPGRNLVLMPTTKHLGISRRIQTDRERRRLRDIFMKRIRAKEVGFIIRTVAEGKSLKELSADADYLQSMWMKIKRESGKKRAPALIHEDLSLAMRTVRDFFTDDVDQFIIDNEEEYENVLAFIEQFMPRHKSRVKLFKGPSQLFEHYGIEAEISRALGKKVWLKSGGYLLVDQSEALTAIDVNTGRYVGSKSLEETILRTNLEAVKEVAYQLRIRNVGGIIIIDLIDMESMENREKVYHALQDALGEDKAKTNILKISELGLVEMTRKRTHEDLVRYLTESCSYCEGRGYHKSKRTVCFEIFREIEKEALEHNPNIVVFANPEVATRMLKEERPHVDMLEDRFKKTVSIRADNKFHVEQYEVFGKQ